MSRMFFALLAGASVVVATSAWAQATPPQQSRSEPVGGQADGAGLDEIIVTAQRRSESLVTVPLSISAMTDEAFTASGIQNLTELKFTTPGLISSTGAGYTQFAIRGIGNKISVGADPSVATFVDDVPRPYASLIDDFVNVERVETTCSTRGMRCSPGLAMASPIRSKGRPAWSA